jgi:two-component SAPR family response regulator
MATPYYRLLATAKHVSDELKTETDRRKAMELCFKKIHASLDLYKGHYINRLRFHMNRHHTEYLRKVRTMAAKPDKPPRSYSSQRVGVATEMANQILRLEQIVHERNEEIERLCALLDDKHA